MPTVSVSDAKELPYVVASRDPQGNVAVASMGRVNDDLGYHHPLAEVAVPCGEVPTKFAAGIFGHFASLTLNFDAAVSESTIVLAQDLLADASVAAARCTEATDITSEVTFSNDRKSLRIPGTLIDEFGLAARSDALDESDPGMVIQLMQPEASTSSFSV